MNKEILEKSLQKAIKGGLSNSGIISWKQHLITDDEETLRRFAPILIFNHDFAKALWPPDDETLEGFTSTDNPMWQYHLQQMVIAQDPIKYLSENI